MRSIREDGGGGAARGAAEVHIGNLAVEILSIYFAKVYKQNVFYAQNVRSRNIFIVQIFFEVKNHVSQLYRKYQRTKVRGEGGVFRFSILEGHGS